MGSTVELLMPAGSFQKMKYAFAYGADAVYLGVPSFSLRARENGFKKREMVVEAVNYAHSLGKKVYVTANILPHNHKIETFIKFIDKFLQECQPDAWIMSDPGLIMLMRNKYPQQTIHLSVQANVVNYATAQFWQKLGIKRIILSRELSIREMQIIHQHCPNLELEAFVHGSICVAYSGRCLISNYMSYRDANQGTCSNSCRWQYKIFKKEDIQPKIWCQEDPLKMTNVTQHGDLYVPLKDDYYLEESERPGEYMPIDEDEHGTYLMNARDLCGIEYLKELCEAGVGSFKVEGRSKSVYYVAMITRAYRRAIDDMRDGKPFNEEYLEDIFATSNRGLTVGFLKGNPGYNAQNFEDGRSQNSSYRFSGILIDYDEKNKYMQIETRNPIHKGMVLEIISPQGSKNFEVKMLFNGRMKEVDNVHGGAGHCFIPYPHNPGAFVLLREKLSQRQDNKS